MNNQLNYAGGCNVNTPDKRDLKYEDILLGAPSIDFNAGYDVRWDLGGDIDYLDQQQSYSCVGCMAAYQVYIYELKEVLRKYSQGSTPKTLTWLRANHPEEVSKISFKAIYSQITYGYGRGSDLRSAGKLVCDWGSVYDNLVPSMKPDGTTDENWVINKTWKNDNIDRIAVKLMGKEYRFIQNINMGMFAQAIKDNFGVCGGVNGINNGTWLTERPTPPTKNDYETQSWKIWGHALWFGAYGTDEFGEFIATPNSWDSSFAWRRKDWTPDKPAGYGWQKLYLNYFTPIKLGDNYAVSIFNPMTFTDKSDLHVEYCNVDDRYFKNENKLKESIESPKLKRALKREPTKRELYAVVYGGWELGDMLKTDEWLTTTFIAASNSGIYTR